MAFENQLARLIAQIAKSESKKNLVSQYGPPLRDDILHDGLVRAGETWGGILGTAAGIVGGEAVGGPRGAILGGAVMYPPAALAGAWGAHGAYLEGHVIRNILSHPENWTVDAAGAIVPVTPAPTPPSSEGDLSRAGELHGPKTANSLPLSTTDPIPHLPPRAPQSAPGGIPGLMASITGGNPSSPELQPPAGGLLRLIQEYMRNNAIESGNR
jgi:hypothetical protein